MELGALLAAELAQNDTLGRWIAQYLAERMTSLEVKTGSERSIAEAEVADLILRLWTLRRQLPISRLPLAEVDEVEAAIAKLTPGRQPWGYFDAFAAGAEPSAEETGASTTLQAALLVDQLAGDLVHGLIGRAAALAEQNEAPWIKHAQKIGDGSLSVVRRFLFADDDGEEKTDRPNCNSEVMKRATALSSVVSTLITELEAEGSELPDEAHG